MFHIVFNVNDPYVKYMAVAISSIVKNTDCNKRFKDFFGKQQEFYNKQLNYDNLKEDFIQEGYIFHVFIDYITEENKIKLEKLRKDLSKYYPIEIVYHYIDNDLFQNCANVGAASNNKITYFKMIIPTILDKKIKYCLYLDVDVLVVRDIRKIFTLELKDNEYLAGVLDFDWLNQVDFISKYDHKNIKSNLKKSYVNTGMMYINLDLWRKDDISQKCLDFLKKYIPLYAEQCAINHILNGKIYVLQQKWNYLSFINPHLNCVDMDIEDKYKIPYTYKETVESYNNIVIIHTHTPKPWDSYLIKHCDSLAFMKKFFTYKYYRYWWNIAFDIKSFGEDFQKLKDEIKSEELLYYARLITQIRQIEHPNQIGAVDIVKGRLSFRLGSMVCSSLKFPFLLIFLPLFLSFTYMKFFLDKLIYRSVVRINRSVKIKSIETYADYNESCKILNSIEYKIGYAFVRFRFKKAFKLIYDYIKNKEKL
ncbi:glycosyltransferase family 8 protein [Campylobacter jejuni]|nr:glycosyltransferase family 8 protein [Campylobacter jejuni]MBX1270333.1 glycosyltransferase family 8 protein [Campylobacter jejuni]MBX1279921.1 glycosyltransferase family 8 protein [Campylobacter jejuni]HDX3797630.1 glycosyltransferase family 8 protein [Campylobacter jejuni]HEC1557871.1 glycosyltransferase family 8 protein [Campylobacter jejuni]